ncbi:chymotrypsin-like protease CTRL-1 [Drosophila takahashii]|uniref:chymotrypsin-like protease CTRL-1 n=1 Tax=Drosophila takahashii TaxID=29030 RepID=UPI001CF912EB|nr:chymotrypsin-like protease CTRL-1 [Drosophila takahashii]
MKTAVIGIPAICGVVLVLLLPLPGSSQFLDAACGIRANPKIATRIINGQIAKYTSSPWMVFLHSTTDLFVCGGTLITNRLVLTAAHCFIANQQLVARLGEYERTRSEECVGYYCNFREEHSVDAGFKHRLYDPNTHANDIAILRLARSVVYRDNIRPICIVWDTRWRQYIDSIDLLTGTGWGKTEAESDSDALRTLDIRRQPPDVCSQFIGLSISGTQFCAGNWESNLCNGDSGGPLGAMVPFKNSQRFIQIGIASYTNRKCQKASVFTDVLSHIDFILRVWRRYGQGQRMPTPRTTTTTQAPTWWQTEQIPRQTVEDYESDNTQESHVGFNLGIPGLFHFSFW